MKITIIAAMTKKGVIGQNNAMPWHMAKELTHFKRETMGKPVIMGRKTFDSLKRKSLPGRELIILSRDLKDDDTHRVAHTIEEALALAGDATEIMIAGGAEVYKKFLPLADRMVISIIHQDYDGNVFFPEIDRAAWQLLEERAEEGFTVQVLERAPVSPSQLKTK